VATHLFLLVAEGAYVHWLVSLGQPRGAAKQTMAALAPRTAEVLASCYELSGGGCRVGDLHRSPCAGQHLRHSNCFAQQVWLDTVASLSHPVLCCAVLLAAGLWHQREG
jgi:hypothetical protein